MDTWKIDWLSLDYLLEEEGQSIFILWVLLLRKTVPMDIVGNHSLCSGRDWLEGQPSRRINPSVFWRLSQVVFVFFSISDLKALSFLSVWIQW